MPEAEQVTPGVQRHNRKRLVRRSQACSSIRNSVTGSASPKSVSVRKAQNSQRKDAAPDEIHLAIADAGRAARGAAARPPAAPLPRAGFAIAGPDEDEAMRASPRRAPDRLSAGQTEHPAMRDREAEAELFRRTVSCAALLEGWRQPWRLDRRGSTRNAPKYRRGDGEVLIVSHQGRGWWDPQSQAKGDVFDLVQFLDPSLNFGEVRQGPAAVRWRCAVLSGSAARDAAGIDADA